MRIGIIEICVEGHYVVVNALVKTYLTSDENKVMVFTTPRIRELLAAQNSHPNLSFIVMDSNSDVAGFIRSMNAFNLDRMHYSTVSIYFKAFYEFEPLPSCQEFFHFHNIDLWFKNAFRLQAIRLREIIRNYQPSVKLFNHVKYSIKDVFRDFYRKKLIRKLISKKVTFVLLSQAQKQYLGNFLRDPDTLIFPSLIFEPFEMPVREISSDKISVCVPGAVIQSKKEYDKFLLVLESDKDFYKQHYAFDLLGKIPAEEKNLLDRIIKLKEHGLEILYYTSFIDVNEFDLQLYRSDIILSNMHMSDGETVQNKETAAVYQMIRGAKPGIFPRYFMLDDYFRDSVVKFADYSKLGEVFRMLADSPGRLNEIQKAAKQISNNFTPENLLKRLIL